MASNPPPQLVLSTLQISKYMNVAALAMFAYDYFLTFSIEVENVWSTKWEITRIVFTLARYLPFVGATLACYDNLFDEHCGGFITATDVTYTASIIFAEGILILRTWALWGRSKKVLLFLLFLTVAFTAGSEIVSLKVKVTMPGDSTSQYQYYPSLCAYGSSRSIAIQYAFLSAFEIILQSMNSWKKFGTYRDMGSTALNTLYWDGIMYMSWIIVFSVANMIVMIAAPLAYIPALDTAQVVVHGVMSCRIFFNLKQCDKQTCSFEEDHSLETLRYRLHVPAEAASANR